MCWCRPFLAGTFKKKIMKSKRRKPLNKIESIFDHRKFLIEKAKELATKMEIKNKGKKLTLVDPIKRIYKYL